MPAGLRELSAPLDSLIEFLGIDEDLVEVAAAASEPLKAGPSRKELAAWIRGLPEKEKDGLLVDALIGIRMNGGGSNFCAASSTENALSQITEQSNGVQSQTF